WPVQASAGPVHEERPGRIERLVAAQPADRVVGEVLTEVVALFGSLRGQDDGGVADEIRLVLRRLAGEETVEVVETDSGGPVVEGTRCGGLLRRSVVPLAESRCGVTVVAQHLGPGGARFRDVPGI